MKGSHTRDISGHPNTRTMEQNHHRWSTPAMHTYTTYNVVVEKQLKSIGKRMPYTERFHGRFPGNGPRMTRARCWCHRRRPDNSLRDWHGHTYPDVWTERARAPFARTSAIVQIFHTMMNKFHTRTRLQVLFQKDSEKIFRSASVLNKGTT